MAALLAVVLLWPPPREACQHGMYIPIGMRELTTMAVVVQA